MATKNLNPITRSATVLAAIEQMRAEAKAAKKAAAKANDPLALIEAAKASTVANGDAEKALWKEYWLAKIDELNAEVADDCGRVRGRARWRGAGRAVTW